MSQKPVFEVYLLRSFRPFKNLNVYYPKFLRYKDYSRIKISEEKALTVGKNAKVEKVVSLGKLTSGGSSNYNNHLAWDLPWNVDLSRELCSIPRSLSFPSTILIGDYGDVKTIDVNTRKWEVKIDLRKTGKNANCYGIVKYMDIYVVFIRSDKIQIFSADGEFLGHINDMMKPSYLEFANTSRCIECIDGNLFYVNHINSLNFVSLRVIVDAVRTSKERKGSEVEINHIATCIDSGVEIFSLINNRRILCESKEGELQMITCTNSGKIINTYSLEEQLVREFKEKTSSKEKPGGQVTTSIAIFGKYAFIAQISVPRKILTFILLTLSKHQKKILSSDFIQSIYSNKFDVVHNSHFLPIHKALLIVCHRNFQLVDVFAVGNLRLFKVFDKLATTSNCIWSILPHPTLSKDGSHYDLNIYLGSMNGLEMIKISNILNV